MQMPLIRSGGYEMRFASGAGGFGFSVVAPDGRTICENAAPAVIGLRDYCAVYAEFAAPYAGIAFLNGKICLKARLTVGAGSAFDFTDTYSALDDTGAFALVRTVTVVGTHADDVGFSSRFGACLTDDSDVMAYEYLAPGAWYKHNEGIPAHRIFSDHTLSTYWYRETRYALPLFMARHTESGRAATLAHIRPDIDSGVYEGTRGWVEWLNSDTLKYGSLGIHKTPDGLSLDYVYPGSEGEDNIMTGMHDRADKVPVNWLRRSHPVREGFTQTYELALRFSQSKNYTGAVRDTWRYFFERFDCPIKRHDIDRVYLAGIGLLNRVTRRYHGIMGLPLTLNLPGGETDNVSFQMGFVGEQIAVGWHLLQYGRERHMDECVQKGAEIIDFWAERSVAGFGLPRVWYYVETDRFLDCPIHIRLVSDGMRAMLEAYQTERQRGVTHENWLRCVKSVGEWFVKNQNEDGSWYRTYSPEDGTPLIKSKYNTTNPMRFLVNLLAETGDEKLKAAVRRAAEFCYEQVYLGFHYSGAIFDGPDMIDKEAFIYALSAFVALYDLYGEERFLIAAKDTADLLETWTYSYEFPVHAIEPTNALNHGAGVSGLSAVTCGSGGGDGFMNFCVFLYYRLYLFTNDAHYLSFARFILHNGKQATNIGGRFPYAYEGMVEEGGGVWLINGYRGTNIWLPWCTYVQIDPIRRLMEVFGSGDPDEIEKLPIETRRRLNREKARFR